MTDPTAAIQSAMTVAPNISGSWWMTTMWIAIGATLAAIIAGTISKQIKISEFRQEWINDLRKDIAEYFSAAEKLQRTQMNIVAMSSDIKHTNPAFLALFEEATTHRHNALPILWRIKMRFNPKQNAHKSEDDDFLNLLDCLIAPDCKTLSVWQEEAEKALISARLILKREWEVTKGFWRSWVPFL